MDCWYSEGVAPLIFLNFLLKLEMELKPDKSEMELMLSSFFELSNWQACSMRNSIKNSKNVLCVPSMGIF